MRRNGIRFIGGSMHGKFMALREEQRWQVPVYSHQASARCEDYNIHTAIGPNYTTEMYERSPLGLGMYAKVYVMRLSTMGEAEFMRRVADIIEGV